MSTLSLVLHGWPEPRSPLTGNGRRRSHWRTIKHAQDDFYDLLFSQAAAQVGITNLPRFEKAGVLITYVFPDERKHDLDNYVAAAKGVLDGLRKLQVLKDDDDKHLILNVMLRVEKGVRETRIEVSEWA